MKYKNERCKYDNHDAKPRRITSLVAVHNDKDYGTLSTYPGQVVSTEKWAT